MPPLKTLKKPDLDNGDEILRVALGDGSRVSVVVDIRPTQHSPDPGLWGAVLANVLEAVVLALLDSELCRENGTRVSRDDIRSRILEILESEQVTD